MKAKHIAALSALVLASNAIAQDISTEITVDRTIVPEQRSAERPANFVPTVQLPRMELKPLALHEYLKASELTSIVPVLEPASYADTIAVTPYRGYAAIGYFPVYNLGASAGYRFINTHNTRMGAWLQFDGNSYKDHDNSYSDNTVAIGADFNRLFKAGHLAVGLDYTYGRTSKPDLDNQLNPDNLILNADQFRADASWLGRISNVVYRASMGFEHFGFRSHFNQQRYTPRLSAQLRGAQGHPSGGLDIEGDFLGGGLGVVTLLPYYSYNTAAFVAHVGLKVDVRSGDMARTDGTTAKRLHVAPDVLLGWTPSSMFAMEARVTGGDRLNTTSAFYRYCHYITPDDEIQGHSNVPVDAQLQFSIGPVAGASLKLFGGYSMANDWLMPMASDLTLHYGAFSPYDIKGWLLGVGVGYRWRDMVDFEATAQMAPQESGKGYYRWLDRARYVVDATLKIHPLDRLDIDLGYEFRGSRVAYTASGSETGLGNKSDLSVGAAYRISNPLSVWARGENLLGRRYDLLPCVPSQGIKGLVGVSYKF